VSIHEFVTDWLRPELQFKIFLFSYCATPHAPKKVIADHYRGVGQRYFKTTGRREWRPLPLHPTPGRHMRFMHNRRQARLGGTLTPSVLKLANSGNNVITMLKGSCWYQRGTYDHPTKVGCKVTKTAIEYALQVNNVKGRTKLYNDWSCCHYNPKTLMDRGYIGNQTAAAARELQHEHYRTNIPSMPYSKSQFCRDCRNCSNPHLRREVNEGADRFRKDAATAIVRALQAL